MTRDGRLPDPYADRLRRAGPLLPSEGIWYYVWLDPRPGAPEPRSRSAEGWTLVVARDVDDGRLGHQELWERRVAPMIVAHYGFGQHRLGRVRRLVYSMPRGRVLKAGDDPDFRVEGERQGCWYLAHGGDFPSCLNVEDVRRRLVGQFGLDRFEVAGMVEMRLATHEQRDAGDVGEMEKLVGAIPW